MALLLGELEQQLRSISHSEEAIQAVQAFSKGLAGTKARLEVWNAANAILRKPIQRDGDSKCLPSRRSTCLGHRLR
jgi:hypothetical protein